MATIISYTRDGSYDLSDSRYDNLGFEDELNKIEFKSIVDSAEDTNDKDDKNVSFDTEISLNDDELKSENADSKSNGGIDANIAQKVTDSYYKSEHRDVKTDVAVEMPKLHKEVPLYAFLLVGFLLAAIFIGLNKSYINSLKSEIEDLTPTHYKQSQQVDMEDILTRLEALESATSRHMQDLSNLIHPDSVDTGKPANDYSTPLDNVLDNEEHIGEKEPIMFDAQQHEVVMHDATENGNQHTTVNHPLKDRKTSELGIQNIVGEYEYQTIRNKLEIGIVKKQLHEAIQQVAQNTRDIQMELRLIKSLVNITSTLEAIRNADDASLGIDKNSEEIAASRPNSNLTISDSTTILDNSTMINNITMIDNTTVVDTVAIINNTTNSTALIVEETTSPTEHGSNSAAPPKIRSKDEADGDNWHEMFDSFQANVSEETEQMKSKLSEEVTRIKTDLNDLRDIVLLAKDIKGEKGDKGEKGERGPRGPRGFTGTKGEKGGNFELFG